MYKNLTSLPNSIDKISLSNKMDIKNIIILIFLLKIYGALYFYSMNRLDTEN